MAEQGNMDVALELLDKIVEKDPNYGAAHFSRANVLKYLGRSDEALKSYHLVSILEPEHYPAHQNLGFMWLAAGNPGRALDHFARTYELRRGDDLHNYVASSFKMATSEKLKHDAGLFRILASKDTSNPRWRKLVKAYETIGAQIGDSIVELSNGQIDILGDDYNTAIFATDAPEIANGVINPKLNWEKIERDFEDNNSGVIWFDDFITEGALKLLNKFLHQSTIWHDFVHIYGFVASYLEEGLACPLLLQIVEEFRSSLPRLLGDRPLTQAWAFKALQGGKPIYCHTDDAEISLNFWLTPDIANRRPESGGMKIYKQLEPDDWSKMDYKNNQGRIKKFLDSEKVECVTIPYRQNRAVLFKSRYFHETDNPDFKSGYNNHRINITMLFGAE